MRNISLVKSYTKWGGEARPWPFFKIEHIPRSTVWNDINLFLLHVQVEVYQNVLKLRCWPLGFILYKAFSKNKKRSGTSLPISFSAWFLKMKISYVINWPNSIAWLSSLLEILGIMCIVTICRQCVAAKILKSKLPFLSKRFPTWPKRQEKIVNTLRTKTAFNMK